MAGGGDSDTRLARDFGVLLASYRRAANLTQEALAAASGLSVRAISDIERGRARGPQQRTVDALSAALGLDQAERDRFTAAARLGRRRPARSTPTEPDWPVTALHALPSSIGDLTGRAVELARLVELATGAVAGPAPGAPDGTAVTNRVAAISGLPGVGKTSLAVAVSHRVADQFPDGQLFLDLRSMDQQPLSPAEALSRVLRFLGIAEARIPQSLDERATLYRALLHDRRVLVVLDNAADEAQVRALLPSGPGCFVLVTSRQVLAGLEAVHRVLLDVLTAQESVTLLAKITGPDRVAAEPAAAAEVAALCGHLPLALRIAGNRLASRPQWTFHYLARQLGDQQRQLALLSAGDVQVRAAFALSYRQLDPAAKLMFRRLSVVPGPDFGVTLGAVAAGVDLFAAEEAIDKLVDANLLQLAPTEGRFRFHDLIRNFAAQTLATEEPDAGPASADRVAGWLVDTATRAGRFFDPDRQGLPAEQRAGSADRADTADLPRPEFTNRAEALSWLDVEIANWWPAARAVARAGGHERVLALAIAMHWYSDVRVQPHPWHELFRLGVAAARALGRRRDEAVLLNFLAWALYYCLGRNHEALAVLVQALEAAREVGDQREAGWAMTYTAAILVRLGQPDRAIDQCQQAVASFRAAGYLLGEVTALSALGVALGAQQQFDRALEIHQQVLSCYRGALAARAPDHAKGGTAIALLSIAEDLAGLRRWRDAVDSYQEAVRLFLANGHEWSAARARYGQSLAHRQLGEFDSALRCLEEARAEFVDSNDLLWQARTASALAELAAESGQHELAQAHRERALQLYHELGSDEAQASG
ncbi:ATP-binding protein [Goodfellowiella coeruleoviolacea]|uniref:Tetratricopeptide repeat-containing protein n=1 Tax=Goodfellowiella coeruleoviolacea TaxID=334858 RepID=A0AAE3G9A1_9PSEU|nr:tetratricopeptide repeat protein [Goodfellowiella coeruleoviolacea]MCP2164027.1 Tetratricopeptide repeat-containing protein [Goodfellowiella coeruleoviolacea]